MIHFLKNGIIKYVAYLETAPPHHYSIVAIKIATNVLTKTTILWYFTLFDNSYLYYNAIQCFASFQVQRPWHRDNRAIAIL